MVGASTILGSFAARLGIDTNDYARGVLQAQAVTTVFGQTFANFITNPLLGSIDLFKKVAAGFAGIATDVLGTAESLQRMSQTTGASTAMIQALRGKMDEASGSGDKLGQALNVLNRQLQTARESGGPLADLFGRLGVDLERLGSTDDSIERILEGINRLPSEAERTRAAMLAFGEEAGPKLVNAVGGGRDALIEIRKAASDLGRVWKSDWIDPLAQGNTDMGNARQALVDLQRVMVAGFLAGFLKEFGSGEDAIRTFASRLQQELIPTLEETGRNLAEITGNAADASRAVGEFFDKVRLTPLAIEGLKASARDTWLGQLAIGDGGGVRFGSGPRTGLEDIFDIGGGR